MSEESTSGDDPEQPVRTQRGHQSSSSRGLWSAEEDSLLVSLIQRLGTKNWSVIARGIHGRTGKSCRLRWYNQLSPELKRGPFEAEEDRTIILAHAEFGNQWSRMAKLLPGRTDNAIKNRWHSALKRTVSEGLPASGSGDLPPVRGSQQQPSNLAASYFGQAQRQPSADSPVWRTSDPADSDRQDAYAQPLQYQERAGLQWRQQQGSAEAGGLGDDEGQQGVRGRRGVPEHPLEGRPPSRPSSSQFQLPPQAPGGGAGGPSLGGGPAGHGFTAEEIAAAQQDGMDLSLLPGVQMAAAQMRALMDNTARAARAEQASGYSLLSSADWDIAQDPSAARLMTPENLANVRKWAAILSSAGEGMDWPGRATAADVQGQQQQQQQPGMPPLTRPAAAAQLHLWQPAQHREVLQIPEGSGWRPRRRMSEALSESDDGLGRLGPGSMRGPGGLYGYPGDPAFAGSGQNLWQASQTAVAAMEEMDARKRARYSPRPPFAGEPANLQQQQQQQPDYTSQQLLHEQQASQFEQGRAQGGAVQFLQVAAEMARREGFPQGPAAPAGLSLAALHAAVGGVPEQLQPLCAPANAPGVPPSRLGRIDSMPLLPSAVHRQGSFGVTGRQDLAATLSAEPLLTGLSPQWVAAQRIPGAPDASSSQAGAPRDAPSPAAPTTSDPVQGRELPFQLAFRDRDTETSQAISE